MKRSKGVLSLEERIARGALVFDDDPGLTEQSHRDLCDINLIMRGYEKTGVLPVMLNQVPRYEDFSQVADYQTALNLVIQADQSFASLDAKVRSSFDNDPSKFLDALEDPSQRAKLVELGVLFDSEGKDTPQVIVDSGEIKAAEGGLPA